jgi:IS30 family transposase
MPYKFQTDKIKLPRALDRRVKLTPEEREQIVWLHKQGTAIRQIARQYPQVSRRLIQMVVFPYRYEVLKAKSRAWRAENGNLRQRVGNARFAEIIREHRRYKQSVQTDAVINKKRVAPANF